MRRKNSPPPGCAIDLKQLLVRVEPARPAPRSPALASSGVGASTTTRIECRCCGNACLERDFTLAPRQIRRNQLVDVGVDGEMLGRIDARNDGHEQSQDDHQPRMARAAGDDRYDRGSKHTFDFISLFQMNLAERRRRLTARTIGPFRALTSRSRAGASTSSTPGRLAGFASGITGHVLVHCSCGKARGRVGRSPSACPVELLGKMLFQA